jgi:hypothetical protein
VSYKVDCIYEVEETDITRVTALKIRNTRLQEENGLLRELYCLLHQRPEPEAESILAQIRSNPDPIAVLKFLKEAELMFMDPSNPARHNYNRTDDLNLEIDDQE